MLSMKDKRDITMAVLVVFTVYTMVEYIKYETHTSVLPPMKQWLHRRYMDNSRESQWLHRRYMANSTESQLLHRSYMTNSTESQWLHRRYMTNRTESQLLHRSYMTNSTKSQWLHRRYMTNRTESQWLHWRYMNNSTELQGLHRRYITNSTASQWLHRRYMDNNTELQGLHRRNMDNSTELQWLHRRYMDNSTKAQWLRWRYMAKSTESQRLHRRYVVNSTELQIKQNTTPTMSDKINHVLLYSKSTSRQGPIKVNMTEPTWAYLRQMNKKRRHYIDLHQPDASRNKDMIAIIIPYRDREAHLKIFLQHMHPFLQRQNISYGIYVIEMDRLITFNRALLMNVGFIEANKRHPYTCYIFHDVDMLPEDDRIMYACPENPTHMSAACSKFNYSLPYDSILGGVTAFNRKDFLQINGYSNLYFGWGGEDDDLFIRVKEKHMEIDRYDVNVARYKMIVHERDATNKVNPRRFELLEGARSRIHKDGLNSISYTLLKVKHDILFTKILIRPNYRTRVYDSPIKTQTLGKRIHFFRSIPRFINHV